MTNYSANPIVVEYAVHSMFKGQSPWRAASTTAKTHHGSTNMFLGGGTEIVEILQAELEAALWKRLIAYTLDNLDTVKPGKEHFVLDGTLLHYNQKPKLRKELKNRIIEHLGRDPFPNDDK